MRKIIYHKGMKICTRCNKELSLEKFSKRKRNKDGLETQCKECLAVLHKAWVAKNPERAREQWRAAAKKYYSYESNRAKILRQYDITADEYETLLIKQNYSCAICGQKKTLCIDHDHSTGQVRGLLCTPCNTSLGKLGDTYESIQKVLDYLARGQVTGNHS